jgi:hypothetical protein
MKRGVLLLLAVLVLAGGVGWYVWQQNKNDNSAVNANQTTQNTNTQNSSDYLVIKEWGVRFKLPTESKNDIYYFYDRSEDQVKFGSRKYAAIEPLCGADKVSLGTGLQRKPLSFTLDSNSEKTLVKTLGQYKYYLVPSSVGCNQNNKLDEQQSAAAGAEEGLVTDSIQTSLEQI